MGNVRLNAIISRAFSIILGVVFVVSGFSKLVNVQKFIGYINSLRYFDLLFGAAFIIPAFEIALGFFFLFFLYSRRVALVSLVVLVIFTFVYLFGYFTSGLTDCGCFGDLALSKLPPALLVVRNAIFISLAGFIYFKPIPKPSYESKKWPYLMLGTIMVICLIMSGVSSIRPIVQEGNDYIGKNVSNTPIGRYVQTNPDSTYIIYAYHTTCPYCLNTVENVKAYKRTHTVDKIIGITMGSKQYYDGFVKEADPNFSSIIIDQADFEKFAPSVPRVFIVKNNKISDVLFFPVTGPYVYWRSHPDMKPSGMP